MLQKIEYSKSFAGQAYQQMDESILKIGTRMALRGQSEKVIRDKIWMDFGEECDWLIKHLHDEELLG